MQKIIWGAMVAFIGIVVLNFINPFAIVRAGNIGVVSVAGRVQDQTLEAGFHLVNPIAQIHKINIQVQTIIYDDSEKGKDGGNLTAASKDLQDVSVAVVTNYSVIPSKAKEVYLQYKDNQSLEVNQLAPIVREGVKAITAQYTAEELVTKRTEVSDRINSLLSDKFKDTPANLESFRIVNFIFSPQFTQAIELKATAVQNAEASKNKLEQVKYEAQQQIEKAKAEAESIRIQAQAITQQGGADYVKLQAIARWDGKLPVQMIPNSAVPFLDLNK